MKVRSKRYDKYFVVLYDKDDNYFKEYESLNHLQRDLNIEFKELYRKIREHSKIVINKQKYSICLYHI